MFFRDSPEVKAEHLRWVIKNTAEGKLEWGMDQNRWAAVGTNVARRLGDAVVAEQNISEVRIGFEQPRYPWVWEFYYLCIRDARSSTHLVEGTLVPPDVLRLAKRTLFVASLAVSSEDGTLSGDPSDCSSCGESTPHLNVHTAPYGIRGAVLVGSERCECAYCGTVAT